ncbi:hypothetical protein SADUNF_Sadunf02G0022200 [Salix dunnii]|uniref:Uncharacterized protein n=1 Tax=Salix dunnii TaxID=1413687 RepID=A0A835N5N4_9ROSI|nr:hypothetical protein SADUNF_Sadunf02G0022200 [Salix dunnii]
MHFVLICFYYLNLDILIPSDIKVARLSLLSTLMSSPVVTFQFVCDICTDRTRLHAFFPSINTIIFPKRERENHAKEETPAGTAIHITCLLNPRPSCLATPTPPLYPFLFSAFLSSG